MIEELVANAEKDSSPEGYVKLSDSVSNADDTVPSASSSLEKRAEAAAWLSGMLDKSPCTYKRECSYFLDGKSRCMDEKYAECAIYTGMSDDYR